MPRPADEVACPKCNAKKGQPCTYVRDKWEWWDDGRKYYAVTYYLKGEPTKHFHQDRIWTHAALQRRNESRRIYEQLKKRDRKKQAIIIAYNQFALAEYEQTKEWLRKFGPILWRGNA